MRARTDGGSDNTSGIPGTADTSPREPHAGIKVFGYDVGEPVVHDELELDIRIAHQQLLQDGPEHGVGRMLTGRGPNCGFHS